MSFLHPAAFAGLASVLLLILLSFWRQRPARVIVPSVRLWERIPDRLPPVRSLRRPRASVSLLLQILVATALVTAMAGPGLTRERPAPRRIAVVIDSSAYMVPRMDDIGREVAKLDRTDDIRIIDTALMRRSAGYFISDSGVYDPRPALELAASEAKEIVFISDRAPSWSPPAGVKLHVVLVGGPLRNVGIVDATVEADLLFVRLSAPSELSVSFDGVERAREPDSVHLMRVPDNTKRIEAWIPADDFILDDRVVLERGEARIDVGFEGRPDAMILAAIESNPRARVVRGGSPRLLIRIGSAPGRIPAPFVIDVEPVDGVESWSSPGELSIAKHPLTEGLDPRDLAFVEVGKLAGPVESAIFYSGGAPVAAVRRPGEMVLAARYASTGWPTRRSFPIFWANVLDYSASGIGAWRAKGLLDETASQPGLVRRPLDPGALEARPLAPHRSDLTAGSVVLAALLLGLLWVVEFRRSGE